jgi:pimeloyl-ACP methyl ester carboxylesterase
MSRATGEALAWQIANAFDGSPHTRRVREVSTSEWTWIELERHDETYPLTIDLLASKTARPDHVLFMLPGGAVNFRASFFSPLERNLAHFMRRQGALIVGISAREDHVPAGLPDYAFMREWGMAKHRADIRSVIAPVRALTQLPSDLLGHSYGAAYALDYAACHAGEVRRVLALDIYSIDPAGDPGLTACERTYAAHLQCMAQGIFHDTSYGGLRESLALALASPFEATKFSRAQLGLPGNFTNKGAFDFSMLTSSVLDGIHTPITGLPGDWPLKRAHIAGKYRLAQDPQQDTASFKHTSYATLREAAAQVGAGVIPVAVERDYWAVNAGNVDYRIAWDAIDSEVLWLNAELGYAHHSHAPELIMRAGNRRVTKQVIAGYGHADLLWGNNAEHDVWQRLVSVRSPVSVV